MLDSLRGGGPGERGSPAGWQLEPKGKSPNPARFGFFSVKVWPKHLQKCQFGRFCPLFEEKLRIGPKKRRLRRAGPNLISAEPQGSPQWLGASGANMRLSGMFCAFQLMSTIQNHTKFLTTLNFD